MSSATSRAASTATSTDQGTDLQMRLNYILSDLGIGLKRNLSMTIAVVVTIWVSLSLFGSALLAHEQVDVLNITTGARFTTYVIEAPRGSRTIGVNGAAARLVATGDRVIVVAYGQMDAAEARQHQPVVVLMGDDNRPKAPALVAAA